MEWMEGEYSISTDKSRLSPGRICELLSKSYWADKRPRKTIEKSIEHSVCYGVYCGGEQVGFARVITDYATSYYICDVILDEKHRGQGLGKKLIECITQDFRGQMGMLATRDAQGLYQKYGFVKDEKSFMRRFPDAE